MDPTKLLSITGKKVPQLNAEVPTTETESFCALVQILPGDVAEDVGKNTRDSLDILLRGAHVYLAMLYDWTWMAARS